MSAKDSVVGVTKQVVAEIVGDGRLRRKAPARLRRVLRGQRTQRGGGSDASNKLPWHKASPSLTRRRPLPTRTRSRPCSGTPCREFGPTCRGRLEFCSV